MLRKHNASYQNVKNSQDGAATNNLPSYRTRLKVRNGVTKDLREFSRNFRRRVECIGWGWRLASRRDTAVRVRSRDS